MMMKEIKSPFLRTLYEYGLITVSIWIMVVGIYFFKFPNHFAFGGVTGFSTVFSQLLHCSASTFTTVASYALLVHMVAQQCDLQVGDFVWTGGDTHLYSNHLEQTNLQLSREPRPLPKLVIKRKPASIFDYRFEDFEIEGYDPHPGIKAPVAI